MTDIDTLLEDINRSSDGEINAISWLKETDFFNVDRLEEIILGIRSNRLEIVKSSVAQRWYEHINRIPWSTEPKKIPVNLRKSAEWKDGRLLPREPLFCPLPPGTPGRNEERSIESLLSVLEKERTEALVVQVSATHVAQGQPTEAVEGFRSCILRREKEDRLLGTLHKLIDGKKGKKAVLVLRCASQLGLITMPTHQQALSEFPGIGVSSGYYKYHEFPFNDSETSPVNIAIQEMMKE